MSHAILPLFRGSLKSRQLPAQLDIWDLRGPLSDLRARSLDVPPAKQVEWGGCIVLNSDRLYMDREHFAKGWENGVNPVCAPDDHENYVGFAHTHLPDEASGRLYPGFSARDFRATLADGDNLSLVCNGPQVFALARTGDRTRPRCEVPEREYESWEKLYEEGLQKAYEEMAADPHAGAALSRILWEINREMCQRLGFAFYQGKFGEPLLCIFRP